MALVGYILIKGVPNLSLDLFQLKYTSDNCSMLPAIFNTIYMTLLSLVGGGAAGHLSRHLPDRIRRRGNKLVKVVRLTTETLQGIPSIVYGLFGYLFFLVQLQWGYSLLAGGDDAGDHDPAADHAHHGGSRAFRAGTATARAASPSARAGCARFSASYCPRPSPVSWRASYSPLAASLARRRRSSTPPAPTPRPRQPVFPGAHAVGTHVCALSEGLHIDQAYATAAVLLIVVVGINALSAAVAKSIVKRRG